ncbi:MAG: DEAD/DEAH box helicase family protein [Richelia sp. CSU_2_1]|nr:DEAD/DEAH box helicase family protein [Richelia sp. CSU_2_1]
MRDLAIQDEYRSDRCDLIQEFYIPCLEKATVYKRAVGFFSSTSMAAAAKGLTALIRVGGKMQLVASPYLSETDAEAIEQGMRQKEEVIVSALQQELDKEFEDIVRDRLACLAWLLSQNILEIKLAVTKEIRRQGIYHEKLGLFGDRENNIIAFTGSANESSTALIDNFECIDVFCSWHLGVRERALKKAENFQKLWENETPNVEVMEFPEAAARELLRLCPDRPVAIEPEINKTRKSKRLAEQGSSYGHNNDRVNQTECQNPSFPLNNSLKVELRLRQVDALNAWQSANNCGILSMATGAGKTITGLACAASIENINVIVIGAPTNEIVQQWVDELANRTTFRSPLIATGTATLWMESLFRKLRLANSRELSSELLPIIVVGSYSEFSKSKVTTLIADAGGLPPRSLLIADEVHATGAAIYRRILRDDFQYRLGLSATPMRAYDEEGTELVLEYFGGVVYEFTLEQAIEAGILCEYDYQVYITPLTGSEYAKFTNLTTKIGRLLNNKEEDAIAQAKRLTIQRSRIIKSAASKLTALGRILSDYPPRTGMIYCADIAQATEVSRLLAQRGFRIARYSSDDVNRKHLLSEFARGNFDALVAVKCLDEGIDIPAADLAIILASDTSERQFIQRRGRVLRAASKKALAKVVDVVVVPPLGDSLVEPIASEIKRVILFARAARNRMSLITKLVDELAPYGITHSDLM